MAKRGVAIKRRRFQPGAGTTARDVIRTFDARSHCHFCRLADFLCDDQSTDFSTVWALASLDFTAPPMMGILS